MHTIESLTQERILRAKGYCRWGEKDKDNPDKEEVEKLLYGWQFVLIEYESGNILKIENWTSPHQTVKMMKSFLAGP